MARLAMGVGFLVVALSASTADAQRLQCPMCDQVAAEELLELESEMFEVDEPLEGEAEPERLAYGAPLTDRELLLEERATLIRERDDYTRSGARILSGGMLGLAGLGAAVGVLAGREHLLVRYDMEHPDGSVTEETSVGLITGLMLAAGLIAAGGLALFINGIHRRRMRRAIDRRLRLINAVAYR